MALFASLFSAGDDRAHRLRERLLAGSTGVFEAIKLCVDGLALGVYAASSRGPPAAAAAQISSPRIVPCSHGPMRSFMCVADLKKKKKKSP